MAARSAPVTAAEKIRLFRSVFRGRPDLFPKRWENQRQGRAGYSPACANEWVTGVCGKPKVKCGECPNQAFLHVDDRVIADHLRGKHTAGVYPLLADDTCWFVAADFDDESWQDDVTALVEVSRDIGLSPAVERSRSGKGAHVWFFFESPVAAREARNMASYLLTETIRLRRELNLRSYDRLFPSQDTLPQGGFGNLIALPFQFEPRKAGNSLFVDDEFNAYPWEEQWRLLREAPRLSPIRVHELSQEAVRNKRIVAAPAASVDAEEDEDAPWSGVATSSSPEPTLPFAIPGAVRAVLAQRLFIAKEGLPSPLLSRLRRLAAFQNPEFYKRQRLRLSTNQIPRVIVCAEELPKYLALPRGCRAAVQNLLMANGSSLLLDDQRNVIQSVPTSFIGTLTDLQEHAARVMLDHECGVLVAPPGSGKTVMGAYVTASRAVRTLVLVHRRPLLEQWVNQLALFLDRSPADIGQIGGGRSQATGTLDVAMFQSLLRGDQVAEIVGKYDQVIIDECHHVPAFTFERVLACVRARFIVGLTATPRRRDGHHPIGEMQLGPVRYVIDAKAQAAARPFGHKLIVRETSFRFPAEKPRIQDVYKALTSDAERNQIIARDVAHVVEQGRSPIVVTERKDHLNLLAELIRGYCPRIFVLHGGIAAKRKAVEPDVPKDSWPRVIVAIGRYVGEGFDDPRLDTLFLTMPLSWKGTLIQYAGRIQRLHPAKREVRIYDYVDRAVPMLERMFRRRLLGYRSIGYVEGDLPLGYGEVDDDFVLGRGWEDEEAPETAAGDERAT